MELMRRIIDHALMPNPVSDVNDVATSMAQPLLKFTTLPEVKNVQQLLTLAIGGMTCGSCATGIDKTVRGHPGVSQVAVNFMHGTATVEFDNTKTSADAIVQVISSIGFQVTVQSCRDIVDEMEGEGEILVLARLQLESLSPADNLKFRLFLEGVIGVVDVAGGNASEPFDVVCTAAVIKDLPKMWHARSSIGLSILSSKQIDYPSKADAAASAVFKRGGGHPSDGVLELNISGIESPKDAAASRRRIEDLGKHLEGVKMLVVGLLHSNSTGHKFGFDVSCVYDYTELGARDLLGAIEGVMDTIAPTAVITVKEEQTSEDAVDLHSILSPALWCVPFAAVVLLMGGMVGPEYLPQWMSIQIVPGIPATVFVALLAATPVQFIFGSEIHRRAMNSFRMSHITVDLFISSNTFFCYLFSVLLILLAVTAAVVAGWPLVTAEKSEVAVNDLSFADLLAREANETPRYFETSALLITVVIWGKVFESLAKRRTTSSLKRMKPSRTSTATIVQEFTTDDARLAIGHERADRSSRTRTTAVTDATLVTKAREQLARVNMPRSSRTSLVIPPAIHAYAVKTVEIAGPLVQRGDLLIVPPGQRVPADGVAISSECSADESLISGESLPIHKRNGDRVLEGSVVYESALWMVATHVGKGTMLGQVIDAVKNSPQVQTPSSQLADTVCSYFLQFTLLIAIGSWCYWGAMVWLGRIVPPVPTSDDQAHITVAYKIMFVMKFGISVLSIACPCALGLATPAALTVSVGKAVSLGVLVKNGLALDSAPRAKTVVLDKTGTLTAGKPAVVSCYLNPNSVLHAIGPGLDLIPPGKLAAMATFGPEGPLYHVSDSAGQPSLDPIVVSRLWTVFWDLILQMETGNKHPLSQALVTFSRTSSFPFHAPLSRVETDGFGVENRQIAGGKGVSADLLRLGKTCCGKPKSELVCKITIGSLPYYQSSASSADELQDLMTWSSAGRSCSIVTLFDDNGGLFGAIRLQDTVLPTAAPAVKVLQTHHKLDVWMCTGDNDLVARQVARETGIREDRVISGATPWMKRLLVEELQKSGGVMMVGDGSNDSLGLALADVGIAIGADAEIMATAADVVLIKHDLEALLSFLHLANWTRSTIARNFLWTFLFNVFSIPAAAGLFYPYIDISPVVAGAAMGLSCCMVIVNSLLLMMCKPVVLTEPDLQSCKIAAGLGNANNIKRQTTSTSSAAS